MGTAIRNPFWQALSTTQAALALTDGPLRRFHPDVAPFAAIEVAGTPVDPNPFLDGRALYFTDALPQLVGDSLTVSRDSMYQMQFEGDVPPPPAKWSNECELGLLDAPAMLAITADVYPGYFRPKTPLMGRYIGLRDGDRIVAMAGERLRFPGAFEISGVCTRKEYAGRGYAQHLIRRLLFHGNEKPMLHVGCGNTRARAIYESLGFAVVAQLELLKIEPALR